MQRPPSRPRAERAFPRASRLTRRADIDRTFREGRKVVDRSLVAFLLPRPEGAPCWRLGLSVSGKVGGSPLRNRVKRVLREAFRHAALPAPPHDLVLVARPGAAPATRRDADDALARVLRRGLAARAPRPEPG